MDHVFDALPSLLLFALVLGSPTRLVIELAT